MFHLLKGLWPSSLCETGVRDICEDGPAYRARRGHRPQAAELFRVALRAHAAADLTESPHVARRSPRAVATRTGRQ